MAVLIMVEYWTVHDEFYRHKDLTQSELFTFTYYYEKFKRVATSRFNWEFDDMFKHLGQLIESYLWDRGQCIVFKHPLVGWMVTDCNVTSYDVNARPNKFRPVYNVVNVGISDYRPILNRYDMNGDFNESEHAIYITDTKDYLIRSKKCIPLIYDIMDTKETIRTQIFNQNAPLFAVASSEKDKTLCKSVLIGASKNQKMYVVDDDVTKNIKCLNLDSPFNVEPLVNYIHEIENEILEFLSVDCTQIFNKKERMITDEVESNNEILQTLYMDCYTPRRYASDCLNKAGLTNTLEIKDFNAGDNSNDSENVEY